MQLLPVRTQTAAMGRPLINIDKALQIASELEDAELTRRMRTRGRFPQVRWELPA